MKSIFSKHIKKLQIVTALLLVVVLVGCQGIKIEVPAKVDETVVITFKLNFDDAPTPIVRTVTKGNTLNEALVGKRKGYTFVEWQTKPTNGEKVDLKTFVFTEKTTLYAHWEIGRYKVTFNLNHVTEDTPPPKQIIRYKDFVTVPDPPPTRVGYTFEGWFTSSRPAENEKAFFVNTIISSDLLLYSKWKVKEYEVSFDLNGVITTDITNAPKTPVIVSHGSNANKPTPDPTGRTGYTFGGWFNIVNPTRETTPFAFETEKITGSTVLYAKWITNEYDITFDLNGATMAEITNPPTTPISVLYSDKVPKPATDPERIGHTFEGWFESANPESDVAAFAFDTELIIGKKTLYAKWKLKDYNVIFDLNGVLAADIMNAPTSPVSVTYGSMVTEPTPNPLGRTGYNFGGWYESATPATGESAFVFISTPITSVTTLYAKWTAIPYNVNFDLNGVANTDVTNPPTTPVPVPFMSMATAPTPNPERTGYTFGGWYESATPATGDTAFAFISTPITNVTTLYAKWTINSYNVIFDLNGVANTDVTNAPPTATVTYGDMATEPTPEIARTGYTFGGWYESATPATGDTAFDFNRETITSVKTLYAKWTINSYNVIFDLNGVAITDVTNPPTTPVPVPFISMATAPTPNPERTGYTFGGWYESATPATGDSAFAFISTPITSVTTLYAKWTINQYNVIFDLNGVANADVTNAPSTATVTYGNMATEPTPEPERTGYTFGGWYESATPATGDTVFAFISTPITSVTTLYAKWAAIPYQVTFNLNGVDATDIMNAPTSPVSIPYGDTVGEPTPIPSGRTGYTFDGWYASATPGTGDSAFDFATETIIRATTLYAKWTQITYQVTFDLNGVPVGDVTNAPPIATVTYGNMATEPTPKPERTGYTFGGWYAIATPGTGDSVFDFDAETITSATTLYAKWTINQYNVIFDLNGVLAVDIMNAPRSPVSISFGDTVEEPTPNPSGRIGYTFGGWYASATPATGDSAFDFATETIIRATTLYAKWTQITFQVTFDLNGAPVGDVTNAPPIATVTDGSMATAPTPNPERTGYTFAGWYESATPATGDTAFAFISTPITSATTLYAKWTINQYQVTFDLNGVDATDVTNAPPTATVTYGRMATAPTPKPERTGFTFGGWYAITSPATGDSAFDFDAETITSATILYAKWTANTYQITFSLNGVDATDVTNPPMPAIIDLSFGSLIPEPTTNPSGRTGYTFGGWYESANPATGDSAFDFDAETITSAITLYAKWDLDQLGVHFDLNGVDATDVINAPRSPVSIPSGDMVEEPTPEIERTGYTFGGWYESANPATGDSAFDFATETITSIKTLYAKWTVNSYNVIFDLNGVDATDVTNAPSTATVTYGSRVAEPTPNPSGRTGYTFAGWYAIATPATGDSAFDFDAETITSATTLYAKWTPITYQITFDLNGAPVGDVTNAPSTATVNYGNMATEPTPKPERTGYTFGGWYASATPATGDTAFDFDAETISSATILYAKWTINQYQVTFNLNGAPVGDVTNAPPTATVTYGNMATEPTPEIERTGFTFGGWYAITSPATGDSAFDFDAETITSAITLYAKWTANTYQITFSLNGVDATDVTNPPMSAIIDLSFGSLIPEPTPKPERTGYTLDGWYESATPATGDTAFDFDAETITSATTLYAKWTINQYQVTFSLNGAPVGDVTNAPPIATVTYDNMATEPTPKPERTGYTFDGWYAIASPATGDTAFDFDAETITSATTLYAKWTANTYQVTFDLNGAPVGDVTNAPPTATVTYGRMATAPTPKPERTGYTLDGWYESASPGTGDSAFDFDAETITSATTLYAKWTINQYQVTFDLNGAPVGDVTNAPPTATVNYGGKATEPTPKPERTGYTFGGWYAIATPATGDSAFDFATETITSATTLYAKWTAIPYNVIFDLNGVLAADIMNAPTSPVSIPFGNTVGEPTPNPSGRTGYTFDGWYESATPATGDSAFDFATETITSATTLYAKWTAIPYNVIFDLNGVLAADIMNAPTSPVSIPFGNTVGEPTPNPSGRTGYTFDGWYESATPATGDSAFDFATETITSATTLYAKWTAIPYQVTFNLNGAPVGDVTNAPPTATVTYGNMATEPTLPLLRTNYAFQGWFESADPVAGASTFAFISTPITGNKELFAKWRFRPETKDALINEINNAIAKDGNEVNLNYIDTSLIKDMSQLFEDKTDFNGNISEWNVSAVTNMISMFNTAKAFNQPISNWNVSAVTNTSLMFRMASMFNQPINNWNVSAVINMRGMFNNANAFNQPLNSWNVSAVKNMKSMFNTAKAFNQPLNSWNVAKVTKMDIMFKDAIAFNGNIGSWDVMNVKMMEGMFHNASKFDGDIGGWNVSSVTTMVEMFRDAPRFNQDISGWNTANVENMSSMFNNAAKFNQPISSWNITKVTNMSSLFNNAKKFDQDLEIWNVQPSVDKTDMFVGSKVTTPTWYP